MGLNQRQKTLAMLVGAFVFLAAVTVGGMLLAGAAQTADFARKDIAPCLQYPFGTDWMGRDMFARTLSGLSFSVRIGLVTATFSALIAFLLGTLAAMNKAADAVISWVIDLLMGVPHMLLLVLISFACGRGVRGVMVGVVLSHWMSLARVVRAETLQLSQSGYVLAAQQLGVGRAGIVRRHMLPHLLPQVMVGLVLLFPHAILHEASITFLGFGMPPEQPAVGVILSESMRYLMMGKWWLAVCPGLLLVLTVALFHAMGGALRRLANPASAHE